MRSLPLLVPGLMLGCSDPDPGAHFISPFDGQTHWPADAPLQVHAGQPVAPEGDTIEPDMLVVVDLDVGGRIEGSVVPDGSDLWFFPDEPFAANHRFAWSIAAPHDEARSVHIGVPPALTGGSTFHTGSLAEPIAALRLGEELCLVLTRGPFADPDAPSLTAGMYAWADGVPARFGQPTEVTLTGIEPATVGAASVACLDLDDARVDAASVDGVRVETVGSVWQLPVQERTVDDILAEQHRLGEGASTDEESSR